jgi:molybdate transport system ATP-binding protein
MDEPLAALDESRKLEILPFIEHLRDAFAIPILYVSHSIEEVARLAATVVKMEKGRVVGVGAPAEVLSPTRVATSIERFEAVSILTGRIAAVDPAYDVTTIAHPAGSIVVPGRLGPIGGMQRLTVGATEVTLARARGSETSVRTALVGRIEKVTADGGPFALVTLALDGGEKLHAYVTRLGFDALGLSVGDPVSALIKAVSIDERGLAGAEAGPAQG